MTHTRNLKREPYYKLSIGLEELLHQLKQENIPEQEQHFDLIIIGSGYGGSIAAAELSKTCHPNGQPFRVCVLERGNEYGLGQFPDQLSDLAGHTRVSTAASQQSLGNADGLFDIRVGNNISAVLGNGLGGGSLINAGVMEIPKASVFDHRWPKSLQGRESLDNYYQESKALLGASIKAKKSQLNAIDNTIELHDLGLPQKNEALQALGKSAHYRPAAITVAMSDKTTCSQMQLKACNYCGDCATGCNHGAKESLDTNLLDLAQQQGAQLVTGATVNKLEKQGQLWCLHTEYTHKNLQQRHGAVIKLRASKVIVAAGTFGSSEILMRSVSKKLPLSQQLGEKFSGNGDMIASAYQQTQIVNGIAKEEIQPQKRRVGPTITGIVEAGTSPKGEAYVFEELAIPAGIRQIFEELTTTSELLSHLNKTDFSRHKNGPVNNDICAVNPDAMAKTSVLAAFGDDGSQGRLKLNTESGNGCITAHWPGLGQHPLFDTQIEQLRQLSQNSDIKGKIIANPMWKFLPDDMDFLAESDLRGPLLTVHPLGGCAMADNGRDGVVNEYGQVFKGEQNGSAVYQDLVVLDGAIIPTALSTNPALTISSVALRAVRALKQQWSLQDQAATNLQSKARSLYHDTLADFPTEAAEKKHLDRSQFKLIERLGGAVNLKGKDYYIDLTASYKAASIKRLSLGQNNSIELDPEDMANNHLRIFHLHDWKQLNDGLTADTELEAKLDQAALYKAPLTGKLVIFEREASNVVTRTARGLYAWFLNRGARDMYQSVRDKGIRGINAPKSAKWKRFLNALALASRAGEVRTLRYHLTLGKAAHCADEFSTMARQLEKQTQLNAVKKLSYTRRANPWRQLMEMRLENFPLAKGLVLKLDTRFLAKRGAPLFRISQQQDQPTAMADGLSFLAYAFRLLINNQLWSFRQPDPHNPAMPERLAGNIEGLPAAEIIELPSGEDKHGNSVYVRLTRYRGKANSGKPPIAMLHGYSNSSTTFAHKAINPNLASYFWQRGHDIWLLDLRTSCGMPTANYPWSFEDVAFNDIPVALAYIYRETGQKINVLAHCMSAAMFSMSILKAPESDHRYFRERSELPDWINCVAFSQVGPRVNFSNDNILRAYLLHYLRQYLPLADYSFRPEGEASMMDLLLDRLLYTLPYPEEEFDLENPPWKFWKKSSFVQNRHRMDALYGRAFSLKNVDPKILNYIDDLFGPLSIETVSQAIHFSRWHSITNKQGVNDYVSRENFIARWRFSTFSVHGEDNGLADVSTVNLMEQAMNDAGRPYDKFVLADYGHQDCLIGRDAEKIYHAIDQFYQGQQVHQALPEQANSAASIEKLSALKPWLGPHIGQWHQAKLPINIGSSPGLSPPLLVVAVPVKKSVNRFVENRAVPRHLRSQDQRGSAGSGILRGGVFPAMVRSGMIKLQLPERLWQYGSDGVLILLIHADDPLLNDPIFARGQGQDDHGEYQQELLPTEPDGTTDGMELSGRQQLSRRSGELNHAIDAAIAERLKDPIDQLTAAFISHAPSAVQAPNKAGPALSFIAASCQYPAGILDQEPAFASYQRLNQLLQQPACPPNFLLLMGDQIYIDATAGIFDPIAKQDRFSRPYQQLFQNPHVAEVRRKLPCYTMLDDHEIINDWEPIADDHNGQHQASMEQGRQAFQHWQDLNPRPLHCKPEQLWYDFEEKDIPFFVADSRTARQHRNLDSFQTAHILGEKQLHELCQWLLKNQHQKNDTPKFIVSPAMPFPRSRSQAVAENPAASLRSDGWNGFSHSLSVISEFILRHDIANVVFLSGDAHMSLISKLELKQGNRTQQLFSVHSSALYAPYPFANTQPQDFALNENFDWNGENGNISCQVKTDADHIDTGPGFAIIELEKTAEQWRMDVQFNRNELTDVQTFTFTNRHQQAERKEMEVTEE